MDRQFKRIYRLINLISLFSILAMLCMNQTWAAGTWSKLKTSGSAPAGRSTPITLPVGTDIYLIGGIRDDYKTKKITFYEDIYRFDTKTNTWEEIKSAKGQPPGRAYPTAVVNNDNQQILIFGGARYDFTFGNQVFYDELWTYSPSNNSWTQLHPLNQGPSARAVAKSWFNDGKMYIFGGSAAKTWEMLDDLWVYDTKTNKWTLLIPPHAPGSPAPRHEIMGGDQAAPPGKLVLYGGLDFTKNIKHNDTWEYDLKTNKWKNITPQNESENIMPPRIFAAGAIIGNYMYLQGGNLSGVGETRGCGAVWPQSASDEFWSFDLTQHVWKKLAPCGDVGLPRLRRNTAAVVDGKMYIFAGWDFQCYGTGPGQIWNSDVFSYDPGK